MAFRMCLSAVLASQGIVVKCTGTIFSRTVDYVLLRGNSPKVMNCFEHFVLDLYDLFAIRSACIIVNTL